MAGIFSSKHCRIIFVKIYPYLEKLQQKDKGVGTRCITPNHQHNSSLFLLSSKLEVARFIGGP